MIKIFERVCPDCGEAVRARFYAKQITCNHCGAALRPSRQMIRTVVTPLQLFAAHLLIASLIEQDLIMMSIVGSVLLLVSTMLHVVAVRRLEMDDKQNSSWFRVSILTCLLITALVAVDVSLFTSGRPWQLRSSRKVAGTFVQEVRFSPDGTSFAATRNLGILAIWDVNTLEEQHVISRPNLPTGPFFMMNLSFSPDGKRILYRSTSALDECFVTRLSNEKTTSFQANEDTQVINAQFLNDQQVIVVLSDGSVWDWDLQTDKNAKRSSIPKGDWATFSPNGKHFVVMKRPDDLDDPYPLKVGEVESGRVSLEIESPFYPKFGPENRWLYVSPKGEQWLRYDLDSKNLDAVPAVKEWNPAAEIVVSNDGTRIGMGNRIYDARTGYKLANLSLYTNIKAFSEDGRIVAAADSFPARLHLFDRVYPDNSFKGIANPKLWLAGILLFVVGWSINRDLTSKPKSRRAD